MTAPPGNCGVLFPIEPHKFFGEGAEKTAGNQLATNVVVNAGIGEFMPVPHYPKGHTGPWSSLRTSPLHHES
jgi:hypothetical protein